ncbi:2-hydroxyacyl-CoA dehydratase subunit D [Mesobacterium pallidum]|uniref:2-hydroxyacyl-CoA dehydratase subunit D n=1 Tax=Mesobacterium pallidum TaxID=2872037 RepID=UPI001EE24A1C|nr:2-hydroxyacyl-CoA dehydratase family protein [Mesobacterium pallidum]
MRDCLARMEVAVSAPLTYAARLKEKTGRPVIGILPMHFPAELAHAAGAIPTLIQDDPEPITVGQSSVFNFYCGYNRSLTDQLLRGAFDGLDAILFGDHCVQLLGTADVIRAERPDLPILFNQLCTTLDAGWAARETRGTFSQLWQELEALTGQRITTEAARDSIRIYNHNRAQIRELYALRQAGAIALSARDMQTVVKSSMVMDKSEHIALMDGIFAGLPSGPAQGLPIYLSGHMCHAPKPAILDLIESCGAHVVGDDLFTGWRYIHADMDESADPVEAMTRWYLDKNRRVPCPTRATRGGDWETYLLERIESTRARGLIILMVKFCEPHMYFYPEIKDAFDARGVPHLLIETEHDDMPLEALKTRVETFVEVAGRKAALTTA